MKKTWIVSCLILSVFAHAPARAEVVQDLKSFLKEQLGDAPKKSKEVFNLSADQKKSMKAVAANATDESLTFYYGKGADDKLKVACTVIPQEGKEGPMTMGVCFEPAGLISAVRILEFNEDHGKGVKKVEWLKQFNGKKVDAPLWVGKDVDGISGATRSSEAVSEGVRKAAFGFTTFVKKK